MKVWLDDIRPAPAGWKWIKTGKQMMELISNRTKWLTVSEISLDHDLGEEDIDGTKIANYIEETAFFTRHLPRWHVHSANPIGARRMRQALENAQKIVYQDKI